MDACLWIEAELVCVCVVLYTCLKCILSCPTDIGGGKNIEFLH